VQGWLWWAHTLQQGEPLSRAASPLQRYQKARPEDGESLGNHRSVPLVLAACLFDECQSLLQAMVCVGREMPTAAGGQGGEDAQASSAQPLDLLPLPNHECHDRRLQQRHPGNEVRGTRLPLLRQLPDSHPVLLWEARSHAAATLPLKPRKNQRWRLEGSLHCEIRPGAPLRVRLSPWANRYP